MYYTYIYIYIACSILCIIEYSARTTPPLEPILCDSNIVVIVIVIISDINSNSNDNSSNNDSNNNNDTSTICIIYFIRSDTSRNYCDPNWVYAQSAY